MNPTPQPTPPPFSIWKFTLFLLAGLGLSSLATAWIGTAYNLPRSLTVSVCVIVTASLGILYLVRRLPPKEKWQITITTYGYNHGPMSNTIWQTCGVWPDKKLSTDTTLVCIVRVKDEAQAEKVLRSLYRVLTVKKVTKVKVG